MSNKKLSSEELQTLKEFRTLNNETIVSLGTIDLQIHRLQKQKESILNGFNKLEEDQTKTAAELEKKIRQWTNRSRKRRNNFNRLNF